MAEHNSTVREGVIAGLIGAASVAIWFLIVDSVSGHPFHTPALLGHAFFTIFGPSHNDSMAFNVTGYTFIHGIAFILVGLLAAYLVHRADTQPAVLAIFLLLFVAFELGFYGLTAMLAETRLADLAWYQIAAGNIIAAATMGTYFWRTHPRLGAQFAEALGDHRTD
jgi:hypothetical protein